MTPDEELEHLDAELERLQSEHPNMPGILRLTDTCLRGCSKWKWEQHGWAPNDGEVCEIMNGNARDRRNALLSVLKGHSVHKVEFDPNLNALEILPDPSGSEPT